MLSRDDELARAIRKKDFRAVVALLFESDGRRLRSGFKSEGELWDFKILAPSTGPGHAPGWAALAADVVAFHNKRGGVIVFGVSDALEIVGIRHRLDSKLVNDRLRKYVGDVLWCEFQREFIQPDQSYVGFLLVQARGPRLLRFVSDAFDNRERVLFKAGDSAIREGDTTQILRGADADAYSRRLALPTVARTFEVDKPYFRILAPEYAHFVERPTLAAAVEQALKDARVSTASLLGIGGAGKTALATWAVLRAYDRGDFEVITSTTAKDRELTESGIVGLPPMISSFETLLDDVLEVVGFPDVKRLPVGEKEAEVRAVLAGTRALLFVDNLETVDDARIVTFLDELPIGVRAIVTSRRTRVRVAVRPIDVGPLTQQEVRAFVRSLGPLPGYGYVGSLSDAEIDRIGDACDRIPLAIRWALTRAESPAEALFLADGITRSGTRGEELLEFSFRRVFDSMSPAERRILETLALFQSPLSTEALLVGAGTTTEFMADPAVLDAVEGLIEDALVLRVFDPNLNDYAYQLLPITRAFVSADLAKHKRTADSIRDRLGSYFEAKDVKDPDARLIIRESRQGNVAAETGLLDLAVGARTRGDNATAQQLFEQALSRNPRSWRVAREYAEFQRHVREDRMAALRLYEQAAANAPRRGSERALIYREWGMLLRDSGEPDATKRATECFEEALVDAPNDELARHALAMMHTRTGQWHRVIELCEPLLNSSRAKTRDYAAATLATAYERTNQRIKAVELRDRFPNRAGT